VYRGAPPHPARLCPRPRGRRSRYRPVVTRNPITRKDFASRVTAALRTEDPAADYAWDELENWLSAPERPTLRLEEHFLEAQGQAPSLLDQLAAAYAHMHVHPPQQPATWEEEKKVVFPYVRPMSFHAHLGFRILQGEKLDPVPHGIVTEHVTVCIGTPTKWRTLPASVEDLKRWGVTIGEAMEQARLNVDARGVPDWKKSNEFEGVYRSPWADEYGISRMLFRDIYRQVPLRGDPVIIVPTWKTFLVAGSDDEQGLVNLGILGAKIASAEGFLIYRPLRARGDELVHWLPPPEHRAHGPLRFLHLANDCSDYAEQATAGRRFFERREEASNIPVPQVCQVGGELGTLVTWAEGPPCALPKADYVMLKRKFETSGVAKWADLQRVVGPELEALGIYPPRWLGRSFPSEWQLSEMDLMPVDGGGGDAD
jgi:hypothetical protein